MNRIDAKFLELKKQRKSAFIAYLTAGYPTIAATEELVLALGKNGVDMFELGIPFSDPLADGPIIQEASTYALRHNVALENIFSLAGRLRAKTDAPLLLMGYYNPILRFGEEKFARRCRQSGVDGIIVADLPIEEAAVLKKNLTKNKIHLIHFVAPTTDHRRVAAIARSAQGFIYYVSLTGVTGARAQLPSDIAAHVRQLKKITKVPVCVGFGVSKRSQRRALSKVGDGVIVGSAIIKKMREHCGTKDMCARVVSFVRTLSS